MRLRRALSILCGIALLYRLPYLLNPDLINSDGAVVGLQAMHILRGEWSWFTWGTNYQASFDSLVHALAFAVFGASPLVMVCVTLAAALLMIALVFLLLRRHLDAPAALVCCAPVVFAPNAWNHFVQMGFRQWALTAFAAIAYALDRARESERWAFAAGLLFFLMLWLDLFTLQTAPALALFAVACLWRQRRKLVALAAGAAISGAFFVWVRHGVAGAGPLQLELSRVPRNLPLLGRCGAWILGARVLQGSNLQPWRAPAPIAAIQWIGAASLLAALLFPARWPRIPPATRWLGLFGLLVIVSSAGGFLLSTWPVDLGSARYLALAAVAMPFALAPLASVLGGQRLALAGIPAMTALLLAGWLAYGEMVHGPLPVRTPQGSGADERALRDELHRRGVEAAAADYWLAYRLSLIFREDPIVSNVEGWERMPAYRTAFERATHKALIFHPSVPQTPASRYESRLRGRGIEFERREIGAYTVLFHTGNR